MELIVKSPLTMTFSRSGGADIQAEVHIWVKKDTYGQGDHPVAKFQFNNSLLVQESYSTSLPKGKYVAVCIGIVRESMNGVFFLSLSIGNTTVYSQKGDVNLTNKPNEYLNFRSAVFFSIA